MNTTSSSAHASSAKHPAPAPAHDGYALDDTLLGRCVQAAAVGVATAIPDYIARGPQRVAAYTLVAGGMLGAIAFANAQREEEFEATASAPNPALADASDAPAWLLPAAVAGAAAIIAVDVKVNSVIAKALRKRGVCKPWTVMGIAGAALTFAVSEAEARDIARKA